MKRTIYTIAALIMSVSVFAQKTINELVEQHDPVVGYIGAKIECPRYDEAAFEPATFNEFYSLLNKDIYGWDKALGEKYHTELQREAFESSPEYKEYAERLKLDYGLIIDEYQYVYMYSLSLAEYDKGKKCFKWNVMSMLNRGDGLYLDNVDYRGLLTTPHIKDPLEEENPYVRAEQRGSAERRGQGLQMKGKIVPRQSNLSFSYLIKYPGKLYSSPYILLPSLPVDVSLKVEENINDCCILFIVHFDKAVSLFNDYGQNKLKVISLKPYEAYIVNKKTKEIYYDITSDICKGKKKKK